MGLSDHERRVVLAIGQTMFPRDAVLGIDADDAGVVAWVEDYLDRMPPFARGQIRALLNTFDYGYAAWAARPRDTFAAARPADRVAYLESWERSSVYTQRMLYEALRAMFTFAYVESEPVSAAIHPGRDDQADQARAAEEA
ncbi:MAG: gluconate 2-dehydrogenase subunit 3 family protein [Myxococcota bacterium]